MQSDIKYKKIRQNSKSVHLKQKDYCFILEPKADQQGLIHFPDFCWMGPYLVQKVLPNNNYIVRKLNTNKTQTLHRILLGKHNTEKPPEVIYQGAQWDFDDNCIKPQDNSYTLTWKADFGGYLFDIPIMYSDHIARSFD